MAERVQAGAMALLMAYTAWARGGSESGYPGPILWLAGLCWIILFWRMAAGVAAGDRTTPSWRRLLADPVFAVSLLFLALLLVQWQNAGRHLVHDAQSGTWLYTPPFRPRWPSAVRANEAAQMLTWFFPAFTLVLCARHGFQSRSSLRFFFHLLVANAVVLGGFGIVQYLSGTKAMFWAIPMPRHHFFASFGYENHAAQFFFLLFCLAFGLAIRRLFRGLATPSARWMLAALGAAVVVLIISVHLSMSRASILMSWLTVILGFVYVAAQAARRFSPAVRFNLVIALLAISLLTFYAVTDAAREKLAQEVQTVATGDRFVKDVNTRWWQIRTAVSIWKENPWWGVGGWGYRHFVGHHLPPNAWQLLAEGRANVHNDTFQFLAEFGAVGLGLLAILVVLLTLPLLRRTTGAHALVLFSVLGLALIYVHSQIDLPFRNPAVLQSWLAILTGLGQYMRLISSEGVRGGEAGTATPAGPGHEP